MNARPLTVPTMGKPFVRSHMHGHRQFQVLSRRLAAPADGIGSPTIEAGRGTGENA